MRYIIDRKTNEHERYDGQNYDATKYRIVEADSDGWIAHTGKECPLPDGVLCEVKLIGSDDARLGYSERWEWAYTPSMGKGEIVAYRPILEKVQEPQYDPRSVSFNLLDRLKAAHEHAQTIPDLEAELREVLGSMGYDLVARSPFVEPEDQDPDAAVKDVLIYGTSVMKNGKHVPLKDFYAEPTEDMTDWRNWREGDVVEVVGAVDSYWRRFYPVGAIRTVVTDNDGDFGVADTLGDVLRFGRLGHKKFKPECFRFHSRPAKREK